MLPNSLRRRLAQSAWVEFYPTQRFGREFCTKFYRPKVEVLNHMKKGKFPSGLRSVLKVLFLILRLSSNFPRDKTNQNY